MTDDAAATTDEKDPPAATKAGASKASAGPPRAPVQPAAKDAAGDEDELSLKELVSYLYEAANQSRPSGPGGADLLLDTSNPAVVSEMLNYLALHARATEGALRKMAEMIDKLRAGS